MQSYHICLINDSFPPAIDGVANAVTNYAHCLNRTDRVSVLTPYYPNADDSVYEFPVLRYPSIDMTELLGYRAGIPLSPELMQQVEHSGFDLIHSHCPITSTLLARMIRDRIDKPLILTYHTKFDIDIANSLRGRLVQQEAIRLLAENISACDEVWTVSRGAGENLRKLGYQGDYIVMPNGVDLPRGRAADSFIRQVTGTYDLPTGIPVFLFVGRMMWYKGIRIILDALARLKAQAQPFRMVFLGSGSDLNEIIAYSRTLRLEQQVFFVPPVCDREQIRAWYCRADLFLFPSTFDTNGLVVREAAACGLASVLVRGSCAAEGVEDGVSGFLTYENDYSMSVLLQRLCTAPDTMRRVGTAAQEKLYLSWEDSVKNARERYGVVIDNYASGVYPRHETFRDDFFHATAQAMDDISLLRSRVRAMQEDASELQQELHADLIERRDHRADRRTRLLNDLHHGIDRFL